MHRGFNVSLTKEFKGNFDLGSLLYSLNTKKSLKAINEFVTESDALSGEKMRQDWFPDVPADIFISHSHADEESAIALGGWLYNTFNLTSFIDSSVWGHADELLKLIDDKHCKNESGSYNYTKRNLSTSHVHMILSTAISMMMDNAECLFLLNTSNSVTHSTAMNSPSTTSPWIYSEIALSRLLRKKSIQMHRKTDKTAALVEGMFRVDHKLELDHLDQVDDRTLNDWEKNFKGTIRSNRPSNALDTLYRILDEKKN